MTTPPTITEIPAAVVASLAADGYWCRPFARSTPTDACRCDGHASGARHRDGWIHCHRCGRAIGA
jgi:hypothetical protein